MYYDFFDPKKNLKLVFCCLVFSFFSAASCYAQDNSQQITQLLTERETLLSQSQPTLEVDRQLFNLGYRPSAQVTVTGNTINFPLFIPDKIVRPITPMESRIKSVNPTLISLTLNESDQSITAVFSQAPSSLNINDIIIHFGFVGYETH